MPCRNCPRITTGIDGAVADTSSPDANIARTGTSTARVPKRSTARPTTGIDAIVAKLAAVNASP